MCIRDRTRAILESRGKVPANLCVVVVCERNAVVPFGLPVTYVISDVEAHVKAATRMLDDQINKIPLAERLIKIPFSIEKVADKDI